MSNSKIKTFSLFENNEYTIIRNIEVQDARPVQSILQNSYKQIVHCNTQDINISQECF